MGFNVFVLIVETMVHTQYLVVLLAVGFKIM